MARSGGFSIENNFSNGLVTEATGLSFPENAVVETDNIIYDQKGLVSRRPGMDMEPMFVYSNPAGINDSYIEYQWESVANDGEISFHVQQIGGTLYVYRISGGSTLSDQLLWTFNLSTFATGTSTQIISNFCQFSTGLGHLVVVHPYCTSFYIRYNKDTGVFTPIPITVYTRDFKGVEPHPVERSSVATDSHLYNLLNQGWDLNKISRMSGMSGLLPSDYDVWWLYKTPDAYGTEVFLTDLAYAAGILNQVDRGNSPAPRGSKILEEFYQDRSTASGIPNIPVVTSGALRPSTTEFHAGRIFYAGVNAQGFGFKVYFSQILEFETQFGKCYQENDPTSQFSSDLLPTDGGVISIPESGTVYKLWSVDNNLLVFASQGIWLITGSQGIGFSATDYTVKRISTVSTLSALSFVKVDGRPVWWGQDDIFVVMPDQTGGLAVQSLSNDRIKTYYQNIPEESKKYAKGAYNNRDRVVQWVFRDSTSSSPSQLQDYTKILNFNTVTKAFYPWTISNPLARIRGVTVLQGQGSEVVQEEITDNLGLTVTDNFINTVYTESLISFSVSAAFKYPVVVPAQGFSFAELHETTHTNWSSLTGGPYRSPGYFVSGYRVRGDAIKKFQTNYLRIFVNNEDPQQFLLSSQWDYSNNVTSLRWSTPQRLFFDTEHLSYDSRRVKIRGHGLAVQFRIETIDDEPLNIIGWSGFESANAAV